MTFSRPPIPGPLRALALGVLFALGVEGVAELRRELDTVAVRAEDAPDELLVGTLSVGVAGLEEGDSTL